MVYLRNSSSSGTESHGFIADETALDETGNGSSNGSMTSSGEGSSVYFIVLDATLVLLIALVGLLGNGLVIVWATRFRRLTVPVNIYVINLAVVDCLFGASLPMIVPNMIARSNIIGSTTCALSGTLMGCCILTSLFTQMTIAIGRCRHVVCSNQPTSAKTSSSSSASLSSQLQLINRPARVACGVVVMLWAAAIITLCPTFGCLYGFAPRVSCITFNKRTHACSYDRDGTLYGIGILVVGIALPLFITIISYAIVYSSLERRQRRRRLVAAAPASKNAVAESSFLTSGRERCEAPHEGHVSPPSENMTKNKLARRSCGFDLMKVTDDRQAADLGVDERQPIAYNKSAVFHIRSIEEISSLPAPIFLRTISESPAVTSLFCDGIQREAEGTSSDVGPDASVTENDSHDAIEVTTVKTSSDLIAKETTKTAATVATVAMATSTPAHGSNSPSVVLACAAKSSFRSSYMARAQDRMLTRVMLCVTVSFVLCFGLYFFVNCADLNADQLPFWAHKLSAWLTYLHCCANPVVYGLTHPQFWSDFVSLVRKCNRRCA